MKFLGATAITCLILTSQCWASPPATKHPRPNLIEALMREVNASKEKAGEHRPIRFETSTDTGFQLGRTDYHSDAIVVTLPPSRTPDFDDAIKSHELFHIILNSRGFAGIGPRTAPNAAALFPANLGGAARETFFESLSITLNSCFPDELIDTETSKRGFKPKTVLNFVLDGKLSNLQKMADNTGESLPEVIKKGQAVEDFCLLRRLSTASRLKYEAATASTMGPTIVMLRKRLLEHFDGKRCEFSKPEACYRLTLELRGAAGLKDVILLPKPKTWELE